MSSFLNMLIKTSQAVDFVITGSTFNTCFTPNYDVGCTIEVHNYTKWDLEKPKIIPNWGQVHQPPVKVNDGHKEVFSVSKRGFCLTGTSGAVRWKLDNDSKKELAVTWSIPYSQVLFSNYLSVAILPKKTLERFAEHLFGKMHYADSTWEFRDCVKGKGFFWNTDPLTYVDRKEKIAVLASMGTGHVTRIVIKIYPLDEDGVSKKIRNKVAEIME